MIMAQLVNGAGKFWSGQAGVWQDGKVRQIVPRAKRVPTLIDDLFENIAKAKDLPLLDCEQPIAKAIPHHSWSWYSML
jgi:hypothetical protein